MTTVIVQGAGQRAVRMMVGKRLFQYVSAGAGAPGVERSAQLPPSVDEHENPPGSKNSRGTATLLLDDLYSFWTYLLVLNLRGIPTSAERLDQIDRQDHLLAEQLGRKSLIA